MRSLYLLIRTEFLSLVGSTNRKGKTPFVVAAILLIVFGLLMIGTMAFTGGVTAYELVKKDLTEFSIFVSISLSMVIALMFGVVNSTRDAKSSDTGMLLAMPIPKSSIVIAKLLGMYLLDVLCTMVMLIPTLWIVCEYGHQPYSVFGRGVLIGFLIPALPLFISLLISALMNFLRKATKFGQFASSFLSIGAVLLYMFVVPRMSSFADQIDITPADAVSKMKIIPPFYWITEAIYSAKPLSVLLTLVITLIPLVLAVYIHTRGLTGVEFHADNSKKARSYKSASPRMAVFKMEFRRYFSSTNYVMNTLFGTLALLAITIIIAVQGVGVLSEFGTVEYEGKTVDLLTYLTGPAWTCIWMIFINFFGSVTFTTPSSVSIEGRRIWLSKSLPIETKDILHSKILVSLLIFQPLSVVCCIILSIVSSCGILPCLLLIVSTSLFQLLTTLVGLIFGLIYARLDWTNEAQVIKNGFAVILSMVINMLLAFIMCIAPIIALIIGKTGLTYIILAAEILVIAGLCAGAYDIITHYGVRKYESLNG